MKGRPRRKWLANDFWDNTEPVPFSGCFIWKRSLGSAGYGQLTVNKIPMTAHRRAWELTYGPVPKGLQVLHHCDVRCCVNPKHLFLGTQSENMLDAYRKGRLRTIRETQTHCRNGHAYTVENIRWVDGVRKCRICRSATLKRYKLRLKSRSL